MSISLSKWPMLPTIAWCFIRAMSAGGDDVLVAGGGDEDVGGPDDVVQRGDLVAVHRRLQRADRVDLGDDDAGALAAQRLGAALADVAVAETTATLPPMRASVARLMPSISECRLPYLLSNLRLGHRVVDVDGREQQVAALGELVEPVDTGRGLLGDALDALAHAGVLRRCQRRRSGAAGRGRRAYSSESSSSALGTAPAFSNSCPCGPAAWRRRRRRGACSGPHRRARSASARCTTSTPRASRPSRRRRARRWARRACRRDRRRPRPRRGPGWRRCCS